MTASDPITPTIEQYSVYQAAWDYYNETLFGGKLKPCILTFSVRNPRSEGYFIPNKWKSSEGKCHEIALNPDKLLKPLIQCMQTLVHEMVHQWQEDFSRPPRAGYHNQEFADKMMAIGLMPSSTGKPGGAMLGQSMGDYVIEGGDFEKAFGVMPDEIAIPWRSGMAPNKKKKTPPKSRYICSLSPHVKGLTGPANLVLFCGVHKCLMKEIVPESKPKEGDDEGDNDNEEGGDEG